MPLILSPPQHPDISTAPDAVERFQTLTAEYSRLLGECRSSAARLELAQAWASLGGIYMAVVSSGAPSNPGAGTHTGERLSVRPLLAARQSVAFGDPAMSALIVSRTASSASASVTSAPAAGASKCLR